MFISIFIFLHTTRIQVELEKKKERTYRLWFAKNNLMFIFGFTIILWWWVNLNTTLLLIPSFVEYHSISFSWCWIIHVPFSKFWQWNTLFLYKTIFKIFKTIFIYGMERNANANDNIPPWICQNHDDKSCRARLCNLNRIKMMSF